MQYRDYYAVLGVPRDADAQRIKQAYRRLARRHHPDLNPGDRTSAERFKEIGEAYTVLSDPDRRRRYDQIGANWGRHQQDFATRAAAGRTGPGPGFGGADFSSFFAHFFGGDSPFGPLPGFGARQQGFAGYRTAARPPDRPGTAAAPVTISLEEALQGAVRQVRTAGDRQFGIRIPPGIEDGARIRARTPEGEVFLTIRIAAHPRFRRDGDNLEVQLPIGFGEAALGGEVEVPTLEGPTRIRIPAGISGGAALRVRGRGMPRTGGGRGDLVARVQIEVPKNLTPEQKDWVRRLQESAGPAGD